MHSSLQSFNAVNIFTNILIETDCGKTVEKVPTTVAITKTKKTTSNRRDFFFFHLCFLPLLFSPHRLRYARNARKANRFGIFMYLQGKTEKRSIVFNKKKTTNQQISIHLNSHRSYRLYVAIVQCQNVHTYSVNRTRSALCPIHCRISTRAVSLNYQLNHPLCVEGAAIKYISRYIYIRCYCYYCHSWAINCASKVYILYTACALFGGKSGFVLKTMCFGKIVIISYRYGSESKSG